LFIYKKESITISFLVYDDDVIVTSSSPRSHSLVGAEQYLTHTQSDLSFSINKVFQFLYSPTTVHMTAVKRILRYLKLTISTGLKIRKSSSTLLSAFSDADWTGCPDDRKSTGGFAVFLGSDIVSWCAKKQPMVSHPSSEASTRSWLMPMKLMWVQLLLKELKISCPKATCDNMGAKYLSSNPVFHNHKKHIEVDYHFI
jgi:hypothetical protein